MFTLHLWEVDQSNGPGVLSLCLQAPAYLFSAGALLRELGPKMENHLRARRCLMDIEQCKKMQTGLLKDHDLEKQCALRNLGYLGL